MGSRSRGPVPLTDTPPKQRSPASAAPPRFPSAPDAPTDTDHTAAAIATPTAPSGASPSPACCHQPTRDYVARRTSEGKTKTEIMRCLKRYIARETFACLTEASAVHG